jgi:Cu-Zn family superoxide dismutase
MISSMAILAKPVTVAGAVISPWMLAASPTDMGAVAEIRGGPPAPQIKGTVFFQDVPGGVWVSVEVQGLPGYRSAEDGFSPVGPYGFHIHQFGNCVVGNPDNPFSGAGEHYNPDNQPHGNHAGDLPVLFSNQGRALMGFFTDRFKVADIVGRSVVIHENPDDYRTQPAGASGKRIACGVIKRYR